MYGGNPANRQQTVSWLRRVGDREEQKETFNSILSSSLQALKNGNFSTSFCMATFCIKQKTLRAPLPCVFGVALRSDFSP